MTCQRCKGLMVEDRFFDLLDSSRQNIPASERVNDFETLAVGV